MKMRVKILSFFTIAIIIGVSNAQVGIGNLNPNATLDISASNQATPTNTDGVLVPRIDAFPATNPGADQNSMVVYLTTIDGTNTPGFYYWDNGTTTWLPFGGVSTPAWELTGNTGTVNGTNFLGTTDAQDLDVRTNNVITHRFTQQGQLEFLNTAQSVFIGDGAGAAHDNSATRRNVLVGFEAGNDITTGVNNNVLGWGALDLNTTGDRNVAIGTATLDNATDPEDVVAIGSSALGRASGVTEDTVAIGVNAMSNSTDSERNVAVGRSAGANTDGPDNVYVGFEADALNGLAGATQNVVIGSGAGSSGAGGSIAYSGRVILGYDAGSVISSQANNTLFIENSSSVTPLLYGEFDNDILRVGGQLQVGSSDDTTTGAIYSFPTVDGTTGQALTTDGSGNVSWSTVSGGGADTQDLSIDNTVGDLSLVDGGTVEIKTIADSDDNTLIQVEEGANDDVIRFDVAGNEHFTMTSKGQLETFNNGQSVLIGEGAGENHDNSASRGNVLVGYEAGIDVTTGHSNNASGWRALWRNITGERNVAIGRQSLARYANPEDNVAIGFRALGNTNSVTEQSVAIGSYALGNTLESERNVAIGQSAGLNIDGPDNVMIGYHADYINANSAAMQNVIVGSEAGIQSGSAPFAGRVLLGYMAGHNYREDNVLFIENSSSVTPLIGGDFANDRLGVNVDMTATTNLTHTLTVGGTIGISELINLKPGTAPATPAEGDVYYDSALKKLRVYTGAAWENLN